MGVMRSIIDRTTNRSGGNANPWLTAVPEALPHRPELVPETANAP